MPYHSENLGMTLDGSVNGSQLQSLMTSLLSVLISAWVENGFLCTEAWKAWDGKCCWFLN